MKDPVAKFCNKMQRAKSDWDSSGGDHRSWLSYYDKKDEARCELIDAVPEASRLDLGEIINHRAPEIWYLIIQHGIVRIKSGCACKDCGTKIPYPAIRCDKCAEAHVQLQKERREVAKITKRKKARKVRR